MDIQYIENTIYDFMDAWKKVLDLCDRYPEFEDAINYGYADGTTNHIAEVLSKNQANAYGLAFNSSFDEAYWDALDWADCITKALERFY